jgi:cell division protein FtsN
MAQASRKARTKTPSRRGPLPGWVWLLAGLAIGLSVALYTYMKDRAQQPAPPPVAQLPAPKPKPAAKADDVKKPAKPRFDFYTILPEMEVVVPDTRAKGGPGAAVDKPGTYILQIGSFRSYAEADNLKAQLALLGVESTIEKVTNGNDDTWHRVRVGPTQDLRELNKIRTRLLNNNINPILLRVKG